jgi:hypothetical protein
MTGKKKKDDEMTEMMFAATLAVPFHATAKTGT